jgi:hypothetical protein
MRKSVGNRKIIMLDEVWRRIGKCLTKHFRTVNLCLISHGDSSISGLSNCPQFFSWVFHWLVCPCGLLLNCLYSYYHKNLQIGYTCGTLTHTTQIQLLKQWGGDYEGQIFYISFYIHCELTSLIPWVTWARFSPSDWPERGATIPARGPLDAVGTATVVWKKRLYF